jgi:phospholipid/cholesterol/gamma-HCH transport system ATP-binding protein
MIEARGLEVVLNGRTAIAGVSFLAERGSLIGIVGPAAAGKTVLLKSLCLLHRPRSGSVLLDGVDLTALSLRELAATRARLGFSFQNLALFDNLDAAGNVAFGLVRRGVPREEARARATVQLKAVGLFGAEGKLPHELSGGMKRRLALARALVSQPEVGLFDDPFVGLDPVACARIARLIARSHAETGGITVIAAGDPAPLFDVADRLLLLQEGRLTADLPVAEFRANAHPSVERYLGQAGAAA